MISLTMLFFPEPNPADTYIRAIVKAVSDTPVVCCTITQAVESAFALSKEDLEGGKQKENVEKGHLSRRHQISRHPHHSQA